MNGKGALVCCPSTAHAILGMKWLSRTAGFAKLRLDTYPPKMGRAIEIYRSLGFRQIPAYNDNPYDVLFMEADLAATAKDSSPPVTR